MKYIPAILIPLCVAVVTSMILARQRKLSQIKEAKMNPNDYIICYSVKWAWLMVIISTVMTAMLVALNLADASNIAVNVIIPPFIVLFLFGAYAIVRYKIVIQGNNITVTRLFGKPKQYTFNEIKRIKASIFSNGEIIYAVYADKKIFSVSDSLAGCTIFLSKAKQNNIHIEEA